MIETKDALAKVDEKFNEHLEDLKSLVRIPSVSFPGFPPETVEESATAVADLLKKRGLENVEILKLDGAHPYVYGEWLKAPGAPTLLLYAHHDVQPPGRDEAWNTVPFEPTEKEGPEGLRLYARGSADDKAGIIVHTAAISAYLDTVGKLPVNVKVIIEGEEETGSEHLEEFLTQYKEKFAADVLCLTDTMNFDCHIPGITIALRGMVVLDVELRAVKNTLHSGMWGGPVPDPVMALSKMIAKLTDENNRIAIPGIWEQVTPLSKKEKEIFGSAPYEPFDEARFRQQCGIVDSARLLREDVSPLVQVWRYPSLTVNAMQASSRAQAGNTINDTAWARLSVRLSPGMSAAKTNELFKGYLKEILPWGLEMTIKEDVAAPPWSTDPDTPENKVAFAAAEAAMEKGYGKKAVRIGCGGSIPFVKPFAHALGGAPVILIGIEDPFTNAHGENESLLLSDFKKACRSQVCFFAEAADKLSK